MVHSDRLVRAVEGIHKDGGRWCYDREMVNAIDEYYEQLDSNIGHRLHTDDRLFLLFSVEERENIL